MSRTALDKVAKTYWDTFYTGMMAVGLPPHERPKWLGRKDATANETLRCLRHAMEELRPYWGKPFDEVFPEKLENRKRKLTANDTQVARRAGAKFK